MISALAALAITATCTPNYTVPWDDRQLGLAFGKALEAASGPQIGALIAKDAKHYEVSTGEETALINQLNDPSGKDEPMPKFKVTSITDAGDQIAIEFWSGSEPGMLLLYFAGGCIRSAAS